jgi:macrocin-O-methyltransferase TylF-like protien
VGGFAIVDDYGRFDECRQAVHDYFDATGTEAGLQRVDDDAVFWQKAGDHRNSRGDPQSDATRSKG